MAAPMLSLISYLPGPVPSDPKDLPRYLRDELENIAAAVRALADGHLETTYVAPAKPREGDIRLADGTQWNPTGSGNRFVGYRGGAWREMG
jgi:hypothetical protein